MSRWATVGFAFVLTALALLQTTTVVAQESAPPPLPIIYQGLALLDGEAVQEGVELMVRVGDWESRPVTVRGGRFINLVAGPTDVGYIGLPITFHLGGLEARQRSTFPELAEPRSENIRLEFEAQNTSKWLKVAGGVVGSLALLLGLALRPWRAWKRQ